MHKNRNTLYAQTVALVTRYTNISIPKTHTTRWVFWVCCAFYLFTASGHTYSPDEETMYAVTRSIVENGRVTINANDDQPLAALRTGFTGGRVAPTAFCRHLWRYHFILSVHYLLHPIRSNNGI